MQAGVAMRLQAANAALAPGNESSAPSVGSRMLHSMSGATGNGAGFSDVASGSHPERSLDEFLDREVEVAGLGLMRACDDVLLESFTQTAEASIRDAWRADKLALLQRLGHVPRDEDLPPRSSTYKPRRVPPPPTASSNLPSTASSVATNARTVTSSDLLQSLASALRRANVERAQGKQVTLSSSVLQAFDNVMSRMGWSQRGFEALQIMNVLAQLTSGLKEGGGHMRLQQKGMSFHGDLVRSLRKASLTLLEGRFFAFAEQVANAEGVRDELTAAGDGDIALSVIRRFVYATGAVGTVSVPNAAGNGQPLWPIVYFLIHSGKHNAAKSLLQGPHSSIRDAIDRRCSKRELASEMPREMQNELERLLREAKEPYETAVIQLLLGGASRVGEEWSLPLPINTNVSLELRQLLSVVFPVLEQLCWRRLMSVVDMTDLQALHDHTSRNQQSLWSWVQARQAAAKSIRALQQISPRCAAQHAFVCILIGQYRDAYCQLNSQGRELEAVILGIVSNLYGLHTRTGAIPIADLDADMCERRLQSDLGVIVKEWVESTLLPAGDSQTAQMAIDAVLLTVIKPSECTIDGQVMDDGMAAALCSRLLTSGLGPQLQGCAESLLSSSSPDHLKFTMRLARDTAAVALKDAGRWLDAAHTFSAYRSSDALQCVGRLLGRQLTSMLHTSWESSSMRGDGQANATQDSHTKAAQQQDVLSAASVLQTLSQLQWPDAANDARQLQSNRLLVQELWLGAAAMHFASAGRFEDAEALLYGTATPQGFEQQVAAVVPADSKTGCKCLPREQSGVGSCLQWLQSIQEEGELGVLVANSTPYIWLCTVKTLLYLQSRPGSSRNVDVAGARQSALQLLGQAIHMPVGVSFLRSDVKTEIDALMSGTST